LQFSRLRLNINIAPFRLYQMGCKSMISRIRGRCGFSRTGTVRLKPHLQERLSVLLVLICAKPSPSDLLR